MAGFVYVATNKYMPGLVKIGFTDRDPITHRVPELFQTGVPSPFKTKYHAFVNEPRSLERKLNPKRLGLMQLTKPFGMKQDLVVSRYYPRSFTEKM